MEKIAHSTYTSITGLVTSISILQDIAGSASKVSSMIPYISAFVPMISIAGIVYFSSRLTGYICIFFHERRPSTKLMVLYEDIAIARGIAENLLRTQSKDVAILFSCLHEIIPSLLTLGIKPPSISPQDSHHAYIITWYNYLVYLTGYSKVGDIQQARNLKVPIFDL